MGAWAIVTIMYPSSTHSPHSSGRLPFLLCFILVPAFLVAGCSFDRSALGARGQDCETNEDCANGQTCSLGTCLSAVARDEDDTGLDDVSLFDSGRDLVDDSADASVDGVEPDTESDTATDVALEAGEDLAEGDAQPLDSSGDPDTLDVSDDPDTLDAEADGAGDPDPGDVSDDPEVVDTVDEPDASDVFNEPEVVDSTDDSAPDSTDVALDLGECFPLGVNVCGGCDLLVFGPGDWCGDCRVYECEEDDDGPTGSLICPEPSGLGDECGDCGGGELVCELLATELSCADPDPLNLCEGCEELDGEPGEVCSCDGEGDADWICSGAEAVECSDENDAPDLATNIGEGNDEGHTDTTGILDRPADVDWFVRVANEDIPGGGGGKTIEPRARLRSDADGDEPYLVCVFYSYSDDRGRNLGTYDCSGSAQCSWWDQSSDEVHQWTADSCTSQEGFDSGTDLYGCCEANYIADGHNRGVTARLTQIDGDGDDRGTAYIRVAHQGAEDSCDEYDLQVGF